MRSRRSTGASAGPRSVGPRSGPRIESRPVEDADADSAAAAAAAAGAAAAASGSPRAIAWASLATSRCRIESARMANATPCASVDIAITEPARIRWSDSPPHASVARFKYARRMRFAARNVGWVAGALAFSVAAGIALGRLGVVIGVAAALVSTLWLWLWLPRAAHAAFEHGRYARAARRYRMLGALA